MCFDRSNCHPEVLKEMRKFYDKPHFLPEEAEHSHIDFVFMGYQQGAFMHVSPELIVVIAFAVSLLRSFVPSSRYLSYHAL